MRRIAIWMLMLFPVVTHANVVWPALYLETRMFSWWAISIGLVAEYLFIRKLLKVTPQKAIAATIAANAASAVLGILLIPLAGMAWEVFPGLLLYHALNMGTFKVLFLSLDKVTENHASMGHDGDGSLA